MKSGRKLIALILCLVLALGTASTAFAATNPTATDIAKEFMAMLKSDGVKYEDKGLTSDGDYKILITYEGENLDTHNITLFVKKSGASFASYEWNLLDYSDSRLLEVLKTVNGLNLQYRYATFLADTTDNTITAQMSGSFQGTAKQCAELLHYAYDWLPIVVDAAWDELESGVLG